MKSSIVIIIVFATCFLAKAQMGIANFKTYSSNEIQYIQENYQLSNLQLYPIKAKKKYHQSYEKVENFINLETALQKNFIEISEINPSGSVNSLTLHNLSNQYIYGLAGEVVLGGKQDRILGEDIKLKPGEKKQVSVYCVEHGRWSPKENGTQFKGYDHVTNNSVRRAAVVEKNQSKVWENVANVVQENNALSSTGTYHALQSSDEYQSKFSHYYEKFKDLWKNDKDVIGVIAVSGNTVIGCDIFATHQLFNNSYNNLLHAYISQAITTGAPVSIDYSEVQNYMSDFLDSYQYNENLRKKGKAFEFDNTTYHLSAF